MRFLILIVFLFSSAISHAQDPVFPSLEGAALYNAVYDAFKPNSTLGNSASKDVLFGEIYLTNSDSVRCVYTGLTVYVDPDEDPSQAAFANGLNTEHTYPKAKGSDGGLAESDLHHLHPSREEVNGDRGNLPFGEVNDNDADDWYYLNQEISNPPANHIERYSEREINEFFEPREDHKGNVARAVFYFWTMYRSEAIEADPDFFDLQRADLCDWHAQDPVDDLEWDRTYLIADHQDNKPNPFILDCTLAVRMYCPDLVIECGTNLSADEVSFQEVAGRIDLYPNPSDGMINLKIDLLEAADLEVRLIDMQGRVLKTLFRGDIPSGEWSQVLNGGNLPSGRYGIQIRLYTDSGLVQMLKPWQIIR